MSEGTIAFSELQREIARAFTDSGTLTATVGDVATDKPCLPTEIDFDEILAPEGGGVTYSGFRTVAMLMSDFTSAPTEGMSVTISDNPSQTAEVIKTPGINGGKYVLTVGYLASEQ